MSKERSNKRIKSFLEYFDNDDLKSKDELRFLKGDIKSELLQKIKEVESGVHSTNRDLPDHIKSISSKLTWDVPYLKKMELRSDNNKILVFSKVINDESYGNKMESICYIEITVNKDMSVLPMINCTITVNNNEVFNEKSMDELMDINELVTLLRGKYMEIVSSWNKYNKSMVGENSFGNKTQMTFDPRFN